MEIPLLPALHGLTVERNGVQQIPHFVIFRSIPQQGDRAYLHSCVHRDKVGVKFSRVEHSRLIHLLHLLVKSPAEQNMMSGNV